MWEFLFNKVLGTLNTLNSLLFISVHEAILLEILNRLRLRTITYFIIPGVYIVAFPIMVR